MVTVLLTLAGFLLGCGWIMWVRERRNHRETLDLLTTVSNKLLEVAIAQRVAAESASLYRSVLPPNLIGEKPDVDVRA